MKKYIVLIVIFSLCSVLLLANLASAGIITEGVSSFGGQVYGGEPRPPQEIAALIIKALMGLLGMVFFALLVYGGFLYMTAAGKEDQIKKAKDTIIRAVIGLLIVLTSYAIASFILGAIGEGTGPGVGSGTSTTPTGGGGAASD